MKTYPSGTVMTLASAAAGALLGAGESFYNGTPWDATRAAWWSAGGAAAGAGLNVAGLVQWPDSPTEFDHPVRTLQWGLVKLALVSGAAALVGGAIGSRLAGPRGGQAGSLAGFAVPAGLLGAYIAWDVQEHGFK